ncbi:relaxase/mobilization nuclease domain-containing protein [Rhizosphaericola mali]|uniref:Relaxase/mobilization nuclease domain-containing protein n=1 Tax=Rhizosphaericola mali TaxID=2545455 RepID=A0A5P2GBG5_9BACT|nr:relaxase/mobilization nuclease domain-containing protein [Rhizosphaericola mali]QES88901.1 relaxase/mobilization nuclease domain-containing protein [Rhizosphaericola mali]
MVAKIMVGKNMNGALNYNEIKVSEGNAALLHADGFLLPKEQLSFQNKLFVFSNRTELNDRAKSNSVHISINFDKKDALNKSELLSITEKYMNQIGFKDQPYLLYEHFDAAHRHVHVVTTNIRYDGTQIPMYNLGRDKSMKACRVLEKEYGLVNAVSKKQIELETIKAIPEKVIYGKNETKSAISNTVRAIIRDYKFTSLAEMNAVLKGFNVEAYRGEPNSKMFEKGGLTYHVLDKKGNHIGVPIKASSIYTKPTLKNMESIFQSNKTKQQPYKNSLQRRIDKLLQTPIKDRFVFQLMLKKQGVDVLFRENESMVYGITFIDHNTKSVFNGSDLGKGYTAKRILERFAESGSLEQQKQEDNYNELKNYIQNINYKTGVQKSVEQIYKDGYQLAIGQNSLGSNKYYLSFQNSENGVRAGSINRFDRYFEEGNITEKLCNHLNEYLIQNGIQQLQQYIQNLFSAQSDNYFGHITADKKKPKRKINW